ncbi:MAG: MOSC N-terminal beta barrel domain-containing protein [Glaciimonas sp.]|nr:MOSC N-terminal beta barrel domain-containing protein [Glaciimonas sp.]
MIVPSLRPVGIHFSATNMATLYIALSSSASTTFAIAIWDDSVIAQDCGDGIADWFSAFIGNPCRLVHLIRSARELPAKNGPGDEKCRRYLRMLIQYC